MATYPRYNARVNNSVKLDRNFYNDGVLFVPYTIEQIEIWKTRYDEEYEAENPGSLLMDTIYGSRVVFEDVANNAYGLLGLSPGTTATTLLTVTEYEHSFVNSTIVDVTHNLGDRYPVVTVYNSLGEILWPDLVTSIDANNIRVEFASAVTGIVDIIGATTTHTLSTATLVRRFVENFTNQTTITVNHNLNDTTPTVAVYDVNYQIIYPDTIQYVNANTVTVTFSVPTSGFVVCTGGGTGQSTVGFGDQAIVWGTVSELFDIHTGENDTLLISVDGGADQTITLTQNYRAQVGDIVTDINGQLTDAKAYVYDTNKIMLKSDSYGSAASLQLKTVANAAYTTLGLAQGTYIGHGYAPSEATGTLTGGFEITSTNKYMLINWDNLGDVNIELAEGSQRGANAIAAEINSAANTAYATIGVQYADVTAGRQLELIGATTQIEIKTIANDAYSELGFTIGIYGTSVTGTQTEYFVVTATNNLISVNVNYGNPTISIILTVGNRTLAQIISECNTQIATQSMDEELIAEPTTGTFGGRINFRALKNDGIIRTGVGEYYADFAVPESFVADGVLLKKFLDVWYYKPDSGATVNTPDDTSYFIVYPNKFFLDTGYNYYDFAFTLKRDLYNKGEKRIVVCDIQPLPKYDTPVINDWILPISDARYKVTSFDGVELQAWTSVDLATGRDLRFLLDTTGTTYRDGIYKVYYEVSLPNGEVIISPSQKFRITAK